MLSHLLMLSRDLTHRQAAGEHRNHLVGGPCLRRTRKLLTLLKALRAHCAVVTVADTARAATTLRGTHPAGALYFRDRQGKHLFSRVPSLAHTKSDLLLLVQPRFIGLKKARLSGHRMLPLCCMRRR